MARVGVRAGFAAAYLQRIAMKMKYLLGTMLMAMALGTTFSSCEKENDSTGIEMRMRNHDNGDDGVTLLKVDDARYYYYNQDYGEYEDSYVYLEISNSNNFDLYREYSDGDIVCVGKVNGLSKITKIPSSGWAQEVAVQPGQGYIIRSKNLESSDRVQYKTFCKYARVYVVDWIEGTSGGIIGAVIRYEDNWKEE